MTAPGTPPRPAGSAPRRSRRSRSGARCSWLPVLVALALGAGCGKRGDPLPPLPRAPQAVAAFTVAQRGAALEVTMAAPQLTTGGQRLGVMEVELLRLVGPGDLEKAGERRRVRVAPGESVRESFPLPPAGSTVKLAARAVHRGQSSVLGKVLTLVVQPPPPPPPTLTAELRPTGVALTWTMPALPSPAPPSPPAATPSPPASPSPAAPKAAASPSSSPTPAPTPPPPPRVRLYRRPEGGDMALLVPDPLAGTSFEDTAVAEGQRWCYVARLTVATDPLVESANSPEACVEVKDVFAPAVPTGLAVLLQDNEVEVSWSPSPDADLKSYRLYRASGGGSPQRVAEVPAGQTSVRDGPAAGEVHVYTLTAVDDDGNESAPSAPARVRRP